MALIPLDINSVANKIGIQPNKPTLVGPPKPAQSVVPIPTPTQLAPKLPTGKIIPFPQQPKVNYVAPLANLGKSLVKNVIQQSARAGASVGVTLAQPFTHTNELKIDSTAPQWLQNLQSKLLGVEPVPNLQGIYKQGAQQAQNIQTKYNIPGSNKLAGLVGGTIGLGMEALNFTGLGGEEKTIQTLTKLTNVEEVANVLRKTGMAEDVIKETAPIIAAAQTPEEVVKALNATKEVATTAATTAEAATKERKFITSVKEEFPQLSEKVAGQYVPRSTDELAQKARTLIQEDINTAKELALKGTDEKAVATASELIKHYSDLKEYDQAAEIANTIATKLTEQGRAVQAASILGRLTPEGQVRFAAREIQKYNEGVKLSKKIPELTGEQAKYITEEMKAIGKMADGQEKLVRFNNLQNYVSDLIPSSFMDRMISVWKAGLLTGIKTSGVNIFANASHFGSEVLKDIPAKIVDSVASLFTGEKTIGGPTIKGTGSGIMEGFKKGWSYFQTGYDESNANLKLDYKRVNFGKGVIGKTVQKYEETIFRLLGAEDQPFYYGAKARSLADQAKAMASNAGLSGKEAQAFIDKTIANPTEKMIYYAVRDAEVATFHNQTVLGEAAKKIQSIGGGAGNIAIPFGRTPAAVAMQIIHYTPVGPVAEIVAQIRNGKFDQRLFSQAMGRGITGTGLLWLGGELFKKGLLALDRPTGEREQKQWELEGRKANSIKIGNKWRSIQVLGPAGNVLLVGGHFADAFKNSGSPTQAISQALAGSWKSFTEQTFLTGLNTLVAAITDPQRSAASWAKSTIGSIIPTIVADVAHATDTKERRTGNGILDTLKSRIPGFRELLQPQVDVLGQEIKRIGNPLEVLADPTRPQGATSTPVIAELRRLTDAGFNVSPTLLGDKNGYKALTPQQNTDLWELAGKITNDKLNALFKSQAYQDMDNEQKAKTVSNFVDLAKINARAAEVIKLTDGLQGDQLKNRLSELKKSGLLTKDVFNQYLKLR